MITGTPPTIVEQYKALLSSAKLETKRVVYNALNSSCLTIGGLSKIVVPPLLLNRQSLPSAKLEPTSRHLQSLPPPSAEHWRVVVEVVLEEQEAMPIFSEELRAGVEKHNMLHTLKLTNFEALEFDLLFIKGLLAGLPAVEENFLLLPSKSAFGWGVSAAVIYYQSVITATLCLEEISGENMPSKSALGWGVSAAVIYYQSVITATVVLGGDFWRKYASCCSFSTLLLLLPEFFMLLRC
nr:hypothetical protein Iba_chr08cCG10920 [Ipomoea batatas]